MAMDPTALADALDELASAIARMRKQHARLAEEKPWMTRDLELARAALAELDGRHAALVAAGARIGPNALADAANAVLTLEARLMKIESTGLPRWQT
jgi:hypothetical protein